MAHDHLNFKLRVSPGNMSGDSLYSLFTAILRPVASAFPIRVWGPISEPNWALDIFTSRDEFEGYIPDPVVELPETSDILDEEGLSPVLPVVDPAEMSDLEGGFNVSPDFDLK